MLATVRHIILLMSACAVFASPSYAYLDPGTGSILLQSILASIAVAIGVLRYYWQGIKAFVLDLIGSSTSGPQDADKALETKSESRHGP